MDDGSNSELLQSKLDKMRLTVSKLPLDLVPLHPVVYA